jgi:phage tail-like protein
MTRVDPVLAYNFVVSFVDSSGSSTLAQNVVVGGFSECSGLEMQLKTEDYEEGGNNGTVLHFPKRINWTNLRLKRGVTFSDELWKWHFGFVEGKGKRRDGIVTLQNDRREAVAVWHFHRGLPVKWTGPSLNAAQSQVAVEEIEIAHEGLRLQTP